MNKTKKTIIYIFSTILLLLVLTNDFHQLVFIFNNSIILYDDYTHYIGYYLISIYIFYLFSKSLIDLAIYRMKIKKDLTSIHILKKEVKNLDKRLKNN